MITMCISLSSLEKRQTNLLMENKCKGRKSIQLKWGWLLEEQLKYERKHAELLDSGTLAVTKHTLESEGFSLYVGDRFPVISQCKWMYSKKYCRNIFFLKITDFSVIQKATRDYEDELT